MTNTLTTECTHCSTRFRLLPAQLEVAQGMVRCGSCRKVFNATEHLNIGAQEDRIKDDFLIQDDLNVNLDAPEFKQELARLAQQEYHARQHANTPESAAEQPLSTPITEPPFDEEAWAAQLLAEEGLAEPVTEDCSDTDQQQISSSPAHNEHANTAQPNRRQEPQLREEFNDLDLDPIELDWQPKPSPWKRRIIWGFLSCITLGIFIAQYTYANFDDLARNQHSRALLQRICPLIGCTLPKYVNVELIKSSNLMVRKHPDFKDALLIDAVIYNRAAYVQAYPLIKLNFLNAEADIIASRSFTSAEYLGGELAGSEHMPAQIPIRISFEVLVPTKLAQSYSIEFLSPQ